MAATVIALPVLGAIIGGAIQLGLLFEAKATLNHAVLQAARAGMSNHAERETISTGLARGLLPLYSPAPGIASVRTRLTDVVFPDVVLNSCVRILNPTAEAVNEFSVGRALPNDDLAQLPATVGASGLNVQDANLLKVYAVYGAPMIVPVIGPLIAAALLAEEELGPFERSLLSRGRLPIVASTTVPMQSRLIGNNFIVTRAELAGGELCRGNLLRSFLDFSSLGDTAQQCLRDTGQVGVVTGGNCGLCRDRILPPDGISTCFACARELGSVASCFNGSTATF